MPASAVDLVRVASHRCSLRPHAGFLWQQHQAAIAAEERRFHEDSERRRRRDAEEDERRRSRIAEEDKERAVVLERQRMRDLMNQQMYSFSLATQMDAWSKRQ